MTDRAHAERLDAEDPLAPLRERFAIDDPETIYLDGNSLGRLPLATRERLGELANQWGSELVGGWHDWIDLPERIGDLLASGVLGARPSEVIVTDSVTVNLFKLAGAVLDTRPGAIVTDAENFPTDRYVLDGLARRHSRELRVFDADPLDGPQPEDVERACAGSEVALVSLSHVAYRSGALADLAAVNELARSVGALVLWDLSHAAGAVPVRLTADGADLAVGCTYKYLNGGPGSPAFLYVRRGLQERLRQPVQGWFGQRDQFAMGQEYAPADRIERYLTGTPPMLSTAALVPAFDLIEEAGVDRLRAKGRLLGELTVELASRWLEPLGFRLASPADPDRRGSHVSLWHPDAWRICRALAEDAAVICDYREPDRIRVGPSPAYTRFTDVWDALDRMRDLVANGRHERFPHEKARVT